MLKTSIILILNRKWWFDTDIHETKNMRRSERICAKNNELVHRVLSINNDGNDSEPNDLIIDSDNVNDSSNDFADDLNKNIVYMNMTVTTERFT